MGDGGIGMPEIATAPDLDVSDRGVIGGQRALITLHVASDVVNEYEDAARSKKPGAHIRRLTAL